MADKSSNELKEMQKLTSSMLKDYDALLKGHGKVNKKLQEQVNIQKNIIAGIKDEKTAKEAIEKLEKRHAILGSKKIDNNKNVIVALQMQNQVVRKLIAASSLIATAEQKRAALLGKVNKISEGIMNNAKNGLDSLYHDLKHIPIIGNLMAKAIPLDKIKGGIDRLSGAFSGGFKGAFIKSANAGGGAMKNVIMGMRGGISGMLKAASRLAPMLAGPQAIIAAIVAVLALGVIRMHQLEKATDAFKKSTGLLNSQMKDVELQISGVSANLRQIGVTMEDVAGYAADFYNQFQGTQQASTDVLNSMGVLEKNFGVAVESQTKLNQLFQASAGLNQLQAQAAIAQTVEAAKLAKVAPNKVIKDMSENSGMMYKFFKGSVKEMQAAAIQAAKMGTSLGEMEKVSRGLLEFETSLTSELQASAILGQRFDLSRARSLAAQKDTVGAYKATIDEVSKLGDINDLSIFQQEAIEKATNMTVEQIANAQMVQKKFNGAKEEELALAMEMVKNGEDVSKLSREDLVTLTERQKKQKEMQGQIHALGDMLKGFGALIMDAFLPLGQAVIGFVTPIVKIISSFYSSFLTPVTDAFRQVGEQLGRIFNMFDGSSKVGKILLETVKFIGKVLGAGASFAFNLLANVLEGIFDVVEGIYNIFAGIFTLDFSQIGKGINQIFGGILKTIFSIPMAITDSIGGAFTSLKDAFYKMWNGVISWIKSSLVGILPSWAQALIGMDTSEPSAKSEQSVNDGVIQKGKVISTNPADTLIATKSPSDLLGKIFQASPLGMLADLGASLTGGGGGKMDLAPLIAEIQGLRADLNSGKIGVSMDGRKVTSGITKISGQAAANSYVQK